MPYYTLSRISGILSDHGLPLKGTKLLVVGVTFKANVNDTRNSPALRLLELLEENGSEVSYSDKHVPNVTLKGRQLESLELKPQVIKEFDASVILVHHSGINIKGIIEHSKLVIDAQNASKDLPRSPKVVKI